LLDILQLFRHLQIAPRDGGQLDAADLPRRLQSWLLVWLFWAVRLSAEQDNLLAAWAWAIDTRNIDTAFSILAGFAPSEISGRCPLLPQRQSDSHSPR
jgi:hypothetical protein